MFRVLVVFLVLVASVNLANAQTLKKDFARCVQGQLDALGEKVGKIDGLPGRATARAYGNLRAQEGYEVLPEAFDTHSLIFSCRYLGDKEAGLKKFWPAWKRSFTITTDAETPAGIVKYITQSMKIVHRRFAAFNMQYASSVNLHVFRDKQSGQGFYLSKVIGKKETQVADFEALYAFNCSNASVGGWSENNNIYICLNYEENDTNINSELSAFQKSAFVDHQFRFQEVMTGEMFHVSQRELLGAFILEEADRSRLEEAKRLEPSWLYEGAAQYFELRFGSVQKAEADYYAERKIELKAELSSLKAFEARSLDLSKSARASDLGDLAAFKLQDGRNLNVFYAFFRAIGLGTPWQEAFEAAFGIRVEKFYADYAKQ